MDLVAIGERLSQAASPQMGLDLLLPGEAAVGQNLTHQFRWATGNHSESITSLVLQAGVTEIEHDVPGLLTRSLTIENEVLIQIGGIWILRAPIRHDESPDCSLPAKHDPFMKKC